jgi:hypothetical protein
MATADDLCKLLQDFLASDVAALKEGVQQVRSDTKDVSTDALSTEFCLLNAMEAMKTEILLTVR